MHTLSILSSGPGPLAPTCRYIKAAIDDGRVANARLGVVVASDADSGALAMADEGGIPYYHISRKTHGENADAAIRDVLTAHGVELVLLVGYEKLVRAPLLEAFPSRILNLHPAPIPQFGGKGSGGVATQRAVLAAGAEYTGPVVHIVDEEYDHGPVLAYWPIKVHPGETAESLEERCNKAGHELWVRTLQNVVEWLDHPEDF